MRAALILLAVLMVGCSPCRRLSRKCPPVIRDSISYVERIEFDTIHLISPADTLYLTIPVEADLNDLIIVNDSPGPKLKLKIADGILEATVICPEDSLKALVANLRTELSQQTTIKVPEPYPVKFVPKFYKWTLVILIIIILLFVGFIYLKVKGAALSGILAKLK